MATKKKVTNKKVTKKPATIDQNLLEKIAIAGEKGTTALQDDVVAMVEANLVEIGPVTADGTVPVRCTAAGLEKASLQVPESTPEVEKADVEEPEIEDGIEMPVVRRNSKGSKLYPLEKMNVGQSFHIAPTEAKPEPAKTVASRISAANKRHKDAGSEIRFAIRRVDETDNKGVGVRVFRIA